MGVYVCESGLGGLQQCDFGIDIQGGQFVVGVQGCFDFCFFCEVCQQVCECIVECCGFEFCWYQCLYDVLCICQFFFGECVDLFECLCILCGVV